MVLAPGRMKREELRFLIFCFVLVVLVVVAYLEMGSGK